MKNFTATMVVKSPQELLKMKQAIEAEAKAQAQAKAQHDPQQLQGMTMYQLWNEIKDNDYLLRLLDGLKCRWADEHRYEDINDYLPLIKEAIPQTTKIYKRPFGFAARCTDGTLKISIYLAQIRAEFKPKKG